MVGVVRVGWLWNGISHWVAVIVDMPKYTLNNCLFVLEFYKVLPILKMNRLFSNSQYKFFNSIQYHASIHFILCTTM